MRCTKLLGFILLLFCSQPLQAEILKRGTFRGHLRLGSDLYFCQRGHSCSDLGVYSVHISRSGKSQYDVHLTTTTNSEPSPYFRIQHRGERRFSGQAINWRKCCSTPCYYCNRESAPTMSVRVSTARILTFRIVEKRRCGDGDGPYNCSFYLSLTARRVMEVP